MSSTGSPVMVGGRGNGEKDFNTYIRMRAYYITLARNQVRGGLRGGRRFRTHAQQLRPSTADGELQRSTQFDKQDFMVQNGVLGTNTQQSFKSLDVPLGEEFEHPDVQEELQRRLKNQERLMRRKSKVQQRRLRVSMDHRKSKGLDTSELEEAVGSSKIEEDSNNSKELDIEALIAHQIESEKARLLGLQTSNIETDPAALVDFQSRPVNRDPNWSNIQDSIRDELSMVLEKTLMKKEAHEKEEWWRPELEKLTKAQMAAELQFESATRRMNEAKSELATAQSSLLKSEARAGKAEADYRKSIQMIHLQEEKHRSLQQDLNDQLTELENALREEREDNSMKSQELEKAKQDFTLSVLKITNHEETEKGLKAELEEALSRVIELEEGLKLEESEVGESGDEEDSSQTQHSSKDTLDKHECIFRTRLAPALQENECLEEANKLLREQYGSLEESRKAWEKEKKSLNMQVKTLAKQVADLVKHGPVAPVTPSQSSETPSRPMSSTVSQSPSKLSTVSQPPFEPSTVHDVSSFDVPYTVPSDEETAEDTVVQVPLSKSSARKMEIEDNMITSVVEFDDFYHAVHEGKVRDACKILRIMLSSGKKLSPSASGAIILSMLCPYVCGTPMRGFQKLSVSRIADFLLFLHGEGANIPLSSLEVLWAASVDAMDSISASSVLNLSRILGAVEKLSLSGLATFATSAPGIPQELLEASGNCLKVSAALGCELFERKQENVAIGLTNSAVWPDSENPLATQIVGELLLTGLRSGYVEWSAMFCNEVFMRKYVFSKAILKRIVFELAAAGLSTEALKLGCGFEGSEAFKTLPCHSLCEMLLALLVKQKKAEPGLQLMSAMNSAGMPISCDLLKSLINIAELHIDVVPTELIDLFRQQLAGLSEHTIPTDIVPTRTSTLECIFRENLTAESARKALMLFREMNSRDISIFTEPLSRLLVFYSGQEDAVSVWELARIASKHQVSLRKDAVAQLVSLVLGYATRKELKLSELTCELGHQTGQAFALLEWVRLDGQTPTLEAYLSVLEIIITEKDFVNALLLMRYGKEDGIRFPAHAYQKVALLLLENKRTDMVLKFLDEMRAVGYRVNKVFYDQMLECCRQNLDSADFEFLERNLGVDMTIEKETAEKLRELESMLSGKDGKVDEVNDVRVFFEKRCCELEARLVQWESTEKNRLVDDHHTQMTETEDALKESREKERTLEEQMDIMKSRLSDEQAVVANLTSANRRLEMELESALQGAHTGSFFRPFTEPFKKESSISISVPNLVKQGGRRAFDIRTPLTGLSKQRSWDEKNSFQKVKQVKEPVSKPVTPLDMSLDHAVQKESSSPLFPPTLPPGRPLTRGGQLGPLHESSRRVQDPEEEEVMDDDDEQGWLWSVQRVLRPHTNSPGSGLPTAVSHM